MQSGGFELTKWASSSSGVMEVIPDNDRNPGLETTRPAGLKTLGICWNPTEDYLSIDVSAVLNSDDMETKRSVLSLSPPHTKQCCVVSKITTGHNTAQHKL
jgi:hypothetical protein